TGLLMTAVEHTDTQWLGERDRNPWGCCIVAQQILYWSDSADSQTVLGLRVVNTMATCERAACGACRGFRRVGPPWRVPGGARLSASKGDSLQARGDHPSHICRPEQFG